MSTETAPQIFEQKKIVYHPNTMMNTKLFHKLNTLQIIGSDRVGYVAFNYTLDMCTYFQAVNIQILYIFRKIQLFFEWKDEITENDMT